MWHNNNNQQYQKTDRPVYNQDSDLHIIYIDLHTVVFKGHTAKTIRNDSLNLLILHAGTQN